MTPAPETGTVDVFVSVIVPLRNDEDVLAGFLDELSGVLRKSYTHYEIVLVDDGSTDATLAAAEDAMRRLEMVRLIRLATGYGREIAVLAGLESVIGDFVVVLLPDSDPCDMIPPMIDLARRGAGIVSAVRRSPEHGSWLMRLGGSVFYWYCNRVLRLAIPRYTTEFRVLTRRVVNAIVRSRDLLCFMRMYSAYIGFPGATVPYDPVRRRDRPRRRSLGEVMRRSVGIIVANSTHPLKVVSLLGLAIAAACALHAGITLAVRLFAGQGGEALGFDAFRTSLLFFFLFLCQAVLTAYLGRLLDERSDRPAYWVLDERSSRVILAEDRRSNVVDHPLERPAEIRSGSAGPFPAAPRTEPGAPG